MEHIRVDKFLDPDRIYPSILREAREWIAVVLRKIIEFLLPIDVISNQWRIANVPLFKKCDRDKPQKV